MAWKQLLDRAQSLAQIEALDGEGAALADQLAAELPAAATLAELEARDAQLATVLDAIDTLAIRAMKVRLEHALADDGSIGPPTRNVFAQTIVTYEDRIELLVDRVRDLAARGRAPSPDRVADLVASAARATLAMRATLRGDVLDLVQRLTRASVPEADRHARDRTLDEPIRKRWSAARRDLELLATDPARISVAPMAARIAAWPAQLDEPEPEREATLAELIEID